MTLSPLSAPARRALPLVLLVAALMLVPRTAAAQEDLGVDNLSEVFGELLSQLLTERFQLSPGPHANHYVPAAELAANTLAPTLNTLIANNVASFPLSSTVAGITFDFSTGQPVQVVESPGPIFAETATTLGANKITLGVNLTHLNLNKLRSINLDEMEFTFLHEDVAEPGRGDLLFELDLVRVRPNLQLSSNIIAFFGSYGVTPNLDVGIAIPFITIRMEGTMQTRIDSYTWTNSGLALHFFDGGVNDPVLTDEVAYSQSATGIGDVALRGKYRFPVEAGVDLAALVDIRLPTGNKDNFFGTGSLNGRFALIGSRKFGAFTPHANVGYNYRGADLDSDELEFALGFDQQMRPGLSLALDLLGEIDLNSFEAIHILPETERLEYTPPNTDATVVEEIRLSNIPDRENDHVLMASFGARWAPTSRIQVLGNVLVPLLQTSLRSTVVPTVGVGIVL